MDHHAARVCCEVFFQAPEERMSVVGESFFRINVKAAFDSLDFFDEVYLVDYAVVIF